MSKYLLLQGYNSYTNRIAKRHNTADEYVANSENWALRENMNFNPNDGVRTQIVYNYTATELCSPNYVVVLDDNATVVSRWFVMEEIRQRNGQIVAILKRDLIADWWDYIIGAPCFIEKATLNYNDPFIFNKENMTYNQIKDENEIFLKDKTETP